MDQKRSLWLWWVLALAGVLVACGEDAGNAAVTAVPPTPTRAVFPTMAAAGADADFIVVATDAPNEPFTDFNQFGELTGLVPDIMTAIGLAADLEFEFVVTPYEGALNGLDKDFSAVMSTLLISDPPPAGVVYTDPYLVLGQVLVVLADDQSLQQVTDLQPGMAVGVVARSSGAAAAREALGLADEDIRPFDGLNQAVQALIEESISGVIMDHYSAAAYASRYPEQLRLVGGPGPQAWIASKGYGMALAAANTGLLDRLNQAIAAVQESQQVAEAVNTWLVADVSQIDAGESRVGTPANELIIGVIGDLNMDPAGAPDLVSWEVMQNTMSGLFRLAPDSTVAPALALSAPAVSADGLEYTIRLRTGLRFPDGSELTAEDVKWSIDRAAVVGPGSFLINNYLKDADDDSFADADAVQVVDGNTVRIVLQEPTAYFPSLLATPPYFPISNECYADVLDPGSVCGGLGPYTIVIWEPGERLRLQANPDWPGAAPVFNQIQLRFYEDAAALRRSVADFQSIDIAWTGLPYADYAALAGLETGGDGLLDLVGWEGPAVFKSYLVFEQETAPWDNQKVRQAASLAVDREALAALFGGAREPLYSPVPDGIPGAVAAEPRRNLSQARSLLLEVGYSQTQPLPITIWYLNDGRYTVLEEPYANALKAQLEETGVFQVTLQSAAWEVFQTQIFSCSYPAYLVGWPSPGAPVNYLDVSSWTNFFVQNTDRGFCSNYESESMTRLVETSRAERDPAARRELLAQIQALWAEELPTLDLTQERRHLLALAKVSGVTFDAMGFLHYDLLDKE